MYKNRKVVCVIPARLASSRLPRKMLAEINGKPLIQWVWEAAMRVKLFDEVIISPDTDELYSVVKGFGAQALMTSERCENGTERLIELQKRGLVQADVWVNWQGDEPFVTASMIKDLLQTCDDEEIWTLRKKIADPTSPHIAKVVCDTQGYALYFSRSAIPYYRESSVEKIYYKHIGLYAYASSMLKKISTLPFSPLEKAEKLEQLRYLEGGLKVRVHETQSEVFGIDTPEQLASARLHLGASSGMIDGDDNARIS